MTLLCIKLLITCFKSNLCIASLFKICYLVLFNQSFLDMKVRLEMVPVFSIYL